MNGSSTTVVSSAALVMRRTLLLAVCCFALPCKAQVCQISITAKESSLGEAMVEFSLVNQATQELKIGKRLLPWEDPNNLLAVLIGREDGEAFDRLFAGGEDIFGNDDVVVPPGQKISGHVDLRNMFDLNDVASVDNATFFWRKTLPKHGDCTFGGWVDF